MNSKNRLGKRSKESEENLEQEIKDGKKEIEEETDITILKKKFFEWCQFDGNHVNISIKKNEWIFKNKDKELANTFFKQIAIVSNIPPNTITSLDLERCDCTTPDLDIVKKINLTQLKKLNLSNAFIQQKDRKNLILLLLQSESIECLDLSGIKLDDEMIKCITKLPNLRELHLSNCNITDKEIKLFSSSKTLEILNLDNNPISDESISTVAQSFPNLKSLHLRKKYQGDAISEICWQHIAKMPQLEELYISKINITASFKDVLACTNLTQLALEQCVIKDSTCIKVILGLSNLKSLDLNHTNLECDQAALSLDDLETSSLETLNLGFCKVHPSQLTAIASIDSLTELNLTEANRERNLNISLQSFKNHPNLQILNLNNFYLNSEDLDFLPTLQSLTEVDLSQNIIDDDGVKKLTKTHTIVKLNLGGNPITDDCLQEILKMHQLEFLDLSHIDLDDTQAMSLKDLSNLKQLVLAGHTNITPKMEYFFATLENLEKFDGTNETTMDRVAHYEFNQLKRVNPQILIAFVKSVEFRETPIDEFGPEIFDEFVENTIDKNTNTNAKKQKTELENTKLGKQEVEDTVHKKQTISVPIPSLFCLTLFTVRKKTQQLSLEEKIKLTNLMPPELIKKL